MPILYGAVAYREDRLQDYSPEIAGWEFTKTHPYPIACPKGGSCASTYRLISEINAAEATVHEQIEVVLNQMEREVCDAHPARIRINPPR